MNPHSNRQGKASFTTPGLWRASTGLALWLLGLTALYVLHALGCRYGWGASGPGARDTGAMGILTWLLLGVWFLFLVGLIRLCIGSLARMRATMRQPSKGPSPQRFMVQLTFAVDLSAAGSMIATGLPVLLVPACM